MIVETGDGLTDSDTYVDPAGEIATAFVAAHLYPEAWNAATTGRRQSAVMHATRTLDSIMEWNGTRASTTQALGWPRTGVTVDRVPAEGVPRAVAHATMELAMAMLVRDRTAEPSGSAAVKKVGLGDGALEIEFGDDPTVAPVRPGEVIPSIVRTMLRGYGWSGGSSQRRVERR